MNLGKIPKLPNVTAPIQKESIKPLRLQIRSYKDYRKIHLEPLQGLKKAPEKVKY